MKIAVLDDYQDAFATLGFAQQLAGHNVVSFKDTVSGQALVSRLTDADIVVLIQQRSPLPRAVIEQLPKLKFISQSGHNVAHLDVAACAERGIVVSAGGGGTPHATSELVWGLILASMRRIPQETQRLADGHWMGQPIGVGLKGKTLGIYAFGKIGKLVADVARAFEMKVVCWGREGSTARAKQAGYDVAASREAFFSACDVMTIHLPLNAGTTGIITAADLALMKPTALLVNTSRAQIIAPGALAEAATLGRPGFAAVDVYESEPVLGGAHPLIGRDNVLCTPHLGYAEEGRYRELLGVACEQVKAYLAGMPINVWAGH
jgi:D-3-phosphoglycerate dehydrogenase / 2-oxoglutarate reductase